MPSGYEVSPSDSIEKWSVLFRDTLVPVSETKAVFALRTTGGSPTVVNDMASFGRAPGRVLIVQTDTPVARLTFSATMTSAREASRRTTSPSPAYFFPVPHQSVSSPISTRSMAVPGSKVNVRGGRVAADAGAARSRTRTMAQNSRELMALPPVSSHRDVTPPRGRGEKCQDFARKRTRAL